jgi:hypothetical protein
MRQKRAQQEDARIESERRLKFRGAARISLDPLQLSNEEYEELDWENVQRLKDAYQEEGCRREAENHRILVLIDRSDLNTALEISGIPAASLLTPRQGDYPELQLRANLRLKCLHGKHRIQAGREFLSPRDMWWIADLYLSGKRMCTFELNSSLTRMSRLVDGCSTEPHREIFK